MKTKHSPAPWVVNPQYGKENVYWLWNENSNYHDDTSPEAMDANARLMEAAPELLAACKEALRQLNADAGDTGRYKQLEAAIAKAEGR